jgi:hypothetical protein
MVLVARRRGPRQPSQWCQDPHEHGARWWWGEGSRPARRCWDAVRDRLGPSLDTLHEPVLHQAVEAGLTRVERGAWDGAAVAAQASRRRVRNAERLPQRLPHLQGARPDEAPGAPPAAGSAGMAPTPRSRTAPSER